MRSALASLLAVMVWWGGGGPATLAAGWTSLDDVARDAIAAGEVPGAVILAGHGNRVFYRKAFGLRAVQPAAEALTIDTVFDVASLTKVVATAPAVLALWDEGRIDLDAPLGRYLREFAQPRHRDVTVRRVLTHTAPGSPICRPRARSPRAFPGRPGRLPARSSGRRRAAPSSTATRGSSCWPKW